MISENQSGIFFNVSIMLSLITTIRGTYKIPPKFKSHWKIAVSFFPSLPLHCLENIQHFLPNKVELKEAYTYAVSDTWGICAIAFQVI